MKTTKFYPHISIKNSKLGSFIPTLNLPAITTCRNNAPCYKDCYATKGRHKFKNVKECYNNNYEAYKDNPVGFFSVVDSYLSMVPYRFFRWHSSGDIPCEDYLDRMCKIARKHKGTKFLCFTKKYELVNEYLANHRKPSNLMLVFSNWGEFICENPHNLPTAWVKLNERTYVPKNAMQCSGNCENCVKTENSCWDLKKGKSVYFHKH